MGAWGAGLYASDLAMDLRPEIAAVSRLPIADTELAAVVVGFNRQTAEDREDEEYSTFWLVLADQFAKRGIDCPTTRAKALAIIDQGDDLAMMRELSMSKGDLAKRGKMLQEVKARLLATAPPKKRATLAAPQPLIMAVGECFAYPISRGQPLNPYFKTKAENTGWKQDGWGGAVVLETGQALGYLAWYRLAPLASAFAQKPDPAAMRAGRFGGGLAAGTCSPTHFKRLELEKVGELPVRPGAILEIIPDLARVFHGDTAAILDISLADNLAVIRVFRGHFEGPLVAAVST